MIRNGVTPMLRFRSLAHRNIANLFNERNFDSSKDYYQILGVTKDTPESDIKKSYYRLAKQYHPDHTKGQDAKFKQINEAYEILSDSTRRRQYDSSRTFGSFANNFRGKAQAGNTNYQEYKATFDRMTPEEQQQVLQQGKAFVKRMGLYAFGLLLFWWLITRKPHRSYEIVNGELIPIQSNQHQPILQPQPFQPQPLPTSPYPYLNPNPSLNPNLNLNPSPQQNPMRPHYYPQYSQNQYQKNTMQSNYSPHPSHPSNQTQNQNGVPQ